MSEALIGRSLGKYQILEKLGQGGMGMVFKAMQPSLNRTVAIKVLPAQLAMDPEFVRRFRQEAQVIASLQHESIVHVYDIDEARLPSGETLYFIVMELVEGQTLRQWAGRGRALPAAEVQRIGGELARALEYAHRRGIVHRDVKSANAMVTRDSRVKLMDFGIAKSAGGIQTMTGSVLGTPDYMAPEQARSGKVTAQTDIYSLGVLLYELATGRLPFLGEDAFSVALQHLSNAPPRPREINAGVPEWLERIILKAMAKDPNDRYASAGQLEAELRVGGVEKVPLAATYDAGAPTLAAGTTPPGWLVTPPPQSWQASPASSPSGAYAPTTPINVGGHGFGAIPPGAQMPPTPPGSYPPPTGPQSGGSGPAGWGAAGAYVPPTPSPAGAGWTPPPPPQTWPPQPYPPAGQTPAPYPPPSGPYPPTQAGGSSTTFFSRPGVKGVVLVGLLALAGVGVVVGGLWSRSQKADFVRGEVMQPGFDPAAPPPPPDPQDSDPAPVAIPARPEPVRTRPVEPPPVYQPPAASEPEPAPAQAEEPAQPAGPSKGELWSQAYRLKDQKKFHSLREVLDRLVAVDSDRGYAEAHEWRREVDEWAADREKDLRGETEDLLEEVIDALGDRDAEHLADQWGGKLEVGTEAFAQEMWDLGPRLKWTGRLRTFKARDDRATFVALITVSDNKNKKLREVAWNGAMVADRDGVRLTSPLR